MADSNLFRAWLESWQPYQPGKTPPAPPPPPPPPSTATAEAWHARPIFISSTFRDMHAERDYLAAEVMPHLAERARALRIHVEPIDLRIGVETTGAAEEAARQLQVLKVCLDDIDRSRPFMVVLVGDRYGWVPPEDRMQAAIREKGFATETRGKSLTALEIEFGVLRGPGRRQRSFFYFRDPLPYAAMPPETAAQYSDQFSREPDAAEAVRKLQALKARVLAEHPDRVRRYAATWDGTRVTGLEDLGRQVLADLLGELEDEARQAAAAPPPDDQEEFIERWSRGFIGRKTLVGMLRRFALTPAASETPWLCCIEGDAGAGKSALFAHLAQELAKEPVLVLPHAAGIGDQSSAVDAMLRRWIERLAATLGEPDPLAPPTPPPGGGMVWDEPAGEALDKIFAGLLRRAAAERRVILVIDALEQFEPTPRARYLTWLPKPWPLNVRLIATAEHVSRGGCGDPPRNTMEVTAAAVTAMAVTAAAVTAAAVTAIEATAAETLAARPDAVRWGLRPLIDDEARAIAEAVYARHHRSPNDDVLRVLLEKRRPDGEPAAGNPLWLELALEELNLLDADDFARAERAYAGTPDERLRQMVLDVAGRLPPGVEELYGWMLDLAEERHGRAEAAALANLIALSRTGWQEFDLSRLMPAAAALEPAAEATGYPLPDEPPHLSLPGESPHLSLRGGSPHPPREGSHASSDAAGTETRRAIPEGAQEAWSSHTAASDHATLAGAGGPAPAGGPAGAPWNALHFATLRRAFRAHIAARGAFGQWDFVHQPMRQAVLRRNLADPALRKELHALIADHLESLPERDRVRAGETIFHLIAADRRHHAARFLAAMDSHTPATRETVRALAGHIRSFGGADPNPGIEWTLSLIVTLTLPDAVWRLCQRLLFDLDAALAGGTPLGVRLRLLTAVRDTLETMLRRNPAEAAWQRDLAVARGRIGNVLLTLGDPAAALEQYQAALAISERLAAADPSNADWRRDLPVGHTKVGDVLLALGDVAGAEARYRAALAIEERLAAEDPACDDRQWSVLVSHERLGDVLAARGNPGAALEEYRTALAAALPLAARDPNRTRRHSDLAVLHERVGRMLLKLGDTAGALREHRAGLALAEDLAARDPADADAQRTLIIGRIKIGETLMALGDAGAALPEFRAALPIADRLAACDPTNAEAQRDAWVCGFKVGNALERLGLPEAAAWYRRACEAFEAMKRRGIAVSPQDEAYHGRLKARAGG